MAKEYVAWPAWFYGPKGEAQIFEKAEDVPQGWQDNPNKFKAAAKADDDEPDDEANADTGGLTREQIIADLERRKVPFKASATDAQLYRKLQKTIDGE